MCTLKGRNYMNDVDPEYLFTLTGGYNVSPDLKEYLSFNGRVVGFTTPDGRVIRMTVALEVEEADGSFSYINSEKEMMQLGFGSLEYDIAEFNKGE
jgi:hypothetical protein